MGRRTRTRSGRPARGSFGQWTTDHRSHAPREHRGWDAAALAFLDGGGTPMWRTDTDITDGGDDHDGTPTRRTTRQPARRMSARSRRTR